MDELVIVFVGGWIGRRLRDRELGGLVKGSVSRCIN